MFPQVFLLLTNDTEECVLYFSNCSIIYPLVMAIVYVFLKKNYDQITKLVAIKLIY